MGGGPGNAVLNAFTKSSGGDGNIPAVWNAVKKVWEIGTVGASLSYTVDITSPLSRRDSPVVDDVTFFVQVPVQVLSYSATQQ
jgi:hypothetical protein